MTREDRGKEGAADEQPAARAQQDRPRRGRRLAAKLEAHRRHVAAWRQRQASGEVVTPYRHVLDDTAEWMIRQGRLLEADRDDRAKVEAAFQLWIDEMRVAEFSRDASQTGPPRSAK